MGAYSVLYNGRQEGNDAYAQYAVDWCWKFSGWARSGKEGLGTCWEPIKGLDEKAYRALLRHFGLTEWQDEFPIDRIIKMSPGELARERRKKEGLHNLPRIEITSDTLGDHHPAEME